MDTEAGILEVERWIRTQKRYHLLIVVAGGSCAGKTVFCQRLQQVISKGGMTSSLLNLDDYFRDIDDPLLPCDQDGHPVFDDPGSYHGEEFMRHIHALMEGKRIFSPHYDLASNTRLSDQGRQVDPTQILLADGLFVLHLIKPYFPRALGVYIEAEDETRLSRRIARDSKLYGIQPDVIRRVYLARILPRHRQFIEPQKRLADIVISTDIGVTYERSNQRTGTNLPKSL